MYDKYLILDLQCCVLVVLEFMSPESVAECIQLTDEIHLLPEDHKAEVDKLEVNYIIMLFFSNFCILLTDAVMN
jgi:lysine-specific demethylase 3